MAPFDRFCETRGIDPGDPHARDLYQEWEETLPQYWFVKGQTPKQDVAELFVTGILLLIFLGVLMSNC